MDYRIGADVNLAFLSMEIDLNKEESTETSICINFSIREYVAEIRKKNPAKCWPFDSLRDLDNTAASSYLSPESTLLSGQNFPSNINSSDETTELSDGLNLFKVENLDGKKDRPEITTDLTESSEIDSDKGKAVYNQSTELTFCKVNDGQTRNKDAKVMHHKAAGNIKPGRIRPRRKSKKFRLLSDIYKDPASELRAHCDRSKIENVNRRFVAEMEDESDDDDVTLAAYFRRQKGVEITDSTLKKKRGVSAVEETSVDQDKKSNRGSVDSIGKDSSVGTSRKKSRTDDVDSQTILEHKKDLRLQCRVSSNEATEREKENEDSEMEAVMLLAHHFNEQKQTIHALETHPTCACIKKKIRAHTTQSGNKRVTKTSSKTATKHHVKKTSNKKLENASVTKTSSKIATKHRVKKNTNKKLEKAAAVGPNAENGASFVCALNRNPADFSVPNGENAFMRGG